MISINPEFEKLIPELTKDELEGLRENLLKNGILDTIKVWKEKEYILDGHNRYRIAKDKNLKYKTETISLKDENEAQLWIINWQLERRNLPDFVKFKLIDKKKSIEQLRQQAKAKQQEHGKTAPGKKKNTSINNDKSIDVQSEIAKEMKVSKGKVAQMQYIDCRATEEEKEQLRRNEKKVGTVYKNIKEREDNKMESEVKKIDDPILYTLTLDSTLNLKTFQTWIEDHRRFLDKYNNVMAIFKLPLWRLLYTLQYIKRIHLEIFDIAVYSNLTPIDMKVKDNRFFGVNEILILAKKGGLQYDSIHIGPVVTNGEYEQLINSFDYERYIYKDNIIKYKEKT